MFSVTERIGSIESKQGLRRPTSEVGPHKSNDSILVALTFSIVGQKGHRQGAHCDQWEEEKQGQRWHQEDQNSSWLEIQENKSFQKEIDQVRKH